MENKIKRFLSLAMALLMVFTNIPVQAFATDGADAGCVHTNTSTSTVAATCNAAGSTTVTCDDCGETLSAKEIPATGEHSYTDGVCTGCGAADPDAAPEESSSEAPAVAASDEAEMITVYFDNSATQWETVYAYWWAADDDYWADAGVKGENDIWAFQIPEDSVEVEFLNGQDGSETEWTVNLAVEANKIYTYTPEVTTVTVYFDNSTTGWETVYAAYGNSELTNPAYQAMTAGENNIWSVEIPEGNAQVLFANAASLTAAYYGPYAIEDGKTYAPPVSTTVVAKIGTAEYSSLAAAVNEAAPGDVITVVEGATETNLITITKNLTIDLGGKTVKLPGLFIIDGTVNISNGTLIGTTSDYSTVQTNTPYGMGNPSVVLTNVNVTGARHALRVEGGSAEVNGGTYTAAGSGTTHAVNVGGDYASTVVINSGTFVGPKGTAADSGAALMVQDKATVTVAGGDFSGGKGNNTVEKIGGTLTISGGTYDCDVSEYVEEGYEATEADGIWTVAEIPTETVVATFEELEAALSTGSIIRIVEDIVAEEALTVPEGVTITVDEGKTLRVLNTLTNNGTINGKVIVSVMVYVEEERSEYNVTATMNGALEGNAPETVAYEISLDGGETWIADTTNGKAQAVIVKTDGSATVYSSFQSAFTSAKSGEVVHMLTDAHVQSTNSNKNNGPLRSYYGLILEGNGHTIYTDLESSGASNEYATIKFTSYLAGTGADVRPVLKNVTIDSQNNAKADLDLVSGDVTFTVTLYNVNLLGNCQYASFAMKSPAMIINKSNVEIYDSSIPSWDAGSANAINFYSGEYSLSFNSKCTVYGGTYAKDPTNYLAPGRIVETLDNGTYLVKLDPTYGMVAQVGETYYETLADAVAAANAIDGGATVTLLANVEVSEAIAVTGNVTIAGAGYSITWADGYNGTLFNVAEGASLTMENVTIDGENAFTFYNDTTTVEDGQNWYTRFVDVGEEDKAVNADVIVNAGNLTLKGVKIQNVTIASDSGNGKTLNVESGGYQLMYNDDLALIKSNGGSVVITNYTKISGNAGLVLNAINADTRIIGGSRIESNMGCGNKGGIIIINGGKASITSGSDTVGIVGNKAMARSATILGVINGAEVTFNAAMEENKHIGVGSNTAGAMIVLEGASRFVMDGGSIALNIGGRAGAIASRWVGGSYGQHEETSIVLNAGTIVGNTASNDGWNGASVFLRSPATIGEGMTINGGIVVNAAPGELDITGGTIFGSLTVTDGLSAEITGGTFDYDPNAWCAEGYKGYENGDGTWTVDVQTDVTISSVADLIAFGAAVTGNTKYQGMQVAANPDVVVNLTADLDLADSGFTPIGNGSGNAFAGTFNGNGHTISNMTLSCDYYRGVGLFRSLASGAVIKNLTIENANVNNGAAAGANHFYGIIAGFSNNLTLENVDVKNSSVTCKYAGAVMVGCLEGTTVIKDCDIENVTLNTTSIRGAVYGTLGNSASGHTADIQNCTVTNVDFIVDGEYKAVKDTILYGEWNDGQAYAESMYVAQIGDTKYTTLYDAVAAAADGDTITLIGDVVRADSLIIDKNITLDLGGYTVSAAQVVNGKPVIRVLAEVTVKNGTVDGTAGTTCYAFIVGNNDTEGTLNIVDGTYKGRVSVVSVTKGTANISGGYFEATEYNGAYEFTLNCIDANYADGSAKIVVTGGSFKGFDPADNKAESGGANFVADGYVSKENNGIYTVEEWDYTIYTKEDLYLFAELAKAGETFEGKTVQLMADIDLNWAEWYPINFYGTFEGNEHTISNITYIPRDDGRMGFFQLVSGPVSDLTLDGIKGTVPANGRFGGFTRYLNAPVENIHVKNIEVTTTDTLAWVGGFTTYTAGGSTNNCSVENLTVNAQAGADLIAGFITLTSNRQLYANSTVTGFKVNVTDTDSSGCGVGGFVAQTQTGWNNPKFENCTVTGIDVTASGLVDVGGFIAWPGAHTEYANNCHTEGKIDVTGVTSENCFAGGFFGNLGWNCDLGYMGHVLNDCSADVDIITKVAHAGGFVGSATNSNNRSMYATFNNCSASGDITSVAGGTADIGGFAGNADRGVYNNCSATGTVTNNGTGATGGFIGEILDTTPKYDSRYPAGTRDYLVDVLTFDSCTGSAEPFIGKVASTKPVSEMITVNSYVAQVGVSYYADFETALAVAKTSEAKAMTLLAPIVITADTTLDLSGVTITGDVYPAFRIQNNANVTVKGGNVTNGDYVFVLGASDGSSSGNLTIESGKYHGTTTVASVTKGTLTINGGEFSADPYEGSYDFLLNCIDANYKDGTAVIEVKGGVFTSFDPANNAAEGANTSFVAEGYISEELTEDKFTVRAASYVAQVGETKYESLTEALNACTNGETVILLTDIVYDADDVVYAHGGATGFGNYDQYNPSIVYLGGTRVDGVNSPSNVNAVLDLNGHSITNNADAYLFLFMDNAKVTIKDSGNGAGIIGNTNYPVIWVTGTDTLITVESGKYTTVNAEGLMWSTHGGDLVITGGEFSTSAEDASLLIIRNAHNRQNSEYFVSGKATVTVTGGSFKGFDPEKTMDDSTTPFTEFNSVAEGFAAIEENGVWTVYNYVEWIKDQLLAGNDVTLEHDIVVDGSMIESIPAVTNGNGKYPNYAIFTVIGEEVTFDLNGHSITYNGHKTFQWNGNTYNSCTVAHGLFYANAGADLTIVDSKGTAEVTVYGLASGGYVASNDTKLTITGGKWVNHGCAECGGTNIFMYPLQGGELYITGGYFEQDLDANGDSYLLVEHGGEYANSVIDYAKTKLVVSGGTFVGMNPEAAHYFQQTADNNLIMGETTNTCADGFVAVENSDGSWTVKPLVTVTFDDVTYVVGNEAPKFTWTSNFTEVSSDGEMLVVETPELDLTAAGEYEITANAYVFGSDKYAVKVVPGKLTIVNAVAAIGETNYATLADAIAAVQNGETIVLLADNAENVTIKQTKDLSFTIDGAKNTAEGGNYTMTGTITVNGNKRSTGAETLTIKNVNFVAEGEWQSSIFAAKNTYVHNLTVDGCSFTGTDAKQAYGIRLHHAYNITVKNTTGTKLYDLVYGQTAVTGFTAENVTVTDSGMGFMMPYGMNMSFKNVTLEVSGAGVGIYNYNASTATFENCNITGAPAIHLEQKNATKAYTLILNGTNTFTGTADGNWLKVLGDDAILKVVVNDSELDLTKTNLVANIGNVYYNSLATAFKDAKDGDTVTVFADHEINGSRILAEGTYGYDAMIVLEGKQVTLDLNGKTVQVTPDCADGADGGLAGCVEAVIFLGKGTNLTVKDSVGNGGFQVNKGSDLYSLFYNSNSTLTIEGGIYNVAETVVSGALIYADQDNTTVINGGIYTLGNASADASTTKPWIFNVHGKNEGSFIQVNGGTFNQNPYLNRGTAKDCEVTIPVTKTIIQITEGEYKGYYTIGDAVAYNVQKELGYGDVDVALFEAEDGQTVKLLMDCVSNDRVTLINAGTYLDLNGKTLSVGNIMAFGHIVDGTVGGDGGLKATGRVILNETNEFLPLFDAANGCYRFFKYELISMGAKSVSGVKNGVKFGVRLTFDNMAGYELLKQTDTSGVKFVLDLRWTDMPENKTILYTFTDGLIQTYAQRFLDGTDSATTCFTVNVAGLDALTEGQYIYATPSIRSESTDVMVASSRIDYMIPAVN